MTDGHGGGPEGARLYEAGESLARFTVGGCGVPVMSV